mmetsp:Transcript_54311/g.174131  ORF Transcript_54311/g.174131 Transcript_54311/m.174131 type:complete len:276 (-) Transcript_54311:96-923(-)
MAPTDSAAGTGGAGEEEVPQIIDGLPLIEAATKLKEEANALVKRKQYNEAVDRYERGIAILDKADGHPMLRQEVEQMVALKAVLYSNAAKCLLDLELFRRAAEAASGCLQLDTSNAKALHRRSRAREALRDWDGALADAVALQKVGGGELPPEELEARMGSLRAKAEAAQHARDEEAAESEDEADTALVRMKQRFDEVVEKYDLRDGSAAEEVADWLTSGEWAISVRRVAQRWKMEEEDAEAFLNWIAKGLEFKVQNASNAAQASAAAPAPSLDV